MSSGPNLSFIIFCYSNNILFDRVIIINEICKQWQLLLAHFIPTSQYTYQYYMTGISLHWGICSEAPILTKLSSKFVWENNRNAYLKDDFSANDDNTYKILPFTLPPYKGEIYNVYQLTQNNNQDKHYSLRLRDTVNKSGLVFITLNYHYLELAPNWSNVLLFKCYVTIFATISIINNFNLQEM